MKSPLLFLFVFLFSTLPAARAIQVVKTLDLTGAVAAQSPGSWANLPASQAIDGNLLTSTGTGDNTLDPWLTITLPAPREIRRVIIHNRADCCRDRFRDLTISAYAGTDVSQPAVYTSALLNPAGILFSPASLQVELPPGTVARTVKIHRKPGLAPAPGILSVGEVVLFTVEDVALPANTQLTTADLAGLSATQSSTWPGLPATLALDGNNKTFTATAAADDHAWWELDLGGEVDLQTLTLINRQDCCQDRFNDLSVSLFDQNHVHLGTEYVSLGIGDPSLTVDFGWFEREGRGTRYLRVSRAGDGTGTEDGNILSLAEVTVTGAAYLSPTLGITPLPARQMLLTWPSGALARYLLETTADLQEPWSWNPVKVPGGNTATSFTVPMDERRRFYRLRRREPGE